jgi:hypothetical protein
MKRFRLIGAMIVAVLALASAFTSSASAAFPLPQVLPSVKGNWTGKNVAGTTPLFLTLAGTHLQCTAATGTGTTEASKTLGLFHITFTGCSALPSGVCTGLGDTSGTILVLGTWHTVIDVDEPSLAAALLILLENVHFTCNLLLFVVRGSVLCLVLEPLSEKATHEFHCTQNNGEADEKKYLNDSGVLTAIANLEASISGAAFEQLGLLALGTVTYEEPVKIDD